MFNVLRLKLKILTQIRIKNKFYILIHIKENLRDLEPGWIQLDKIQLQFVLICLQNKKNIIIFHLVKQRQFYMNLDTLSTILCQILNYNLKEVQMLLGISLKFQVNLMKTLLLKGNSQIQSDQMKMDKKYQKN